MTVDNLDGLRAMSASLATSAADHAAAGVKLATQAQALAVALNAYSPPLPPPVDNPVPFGRFVFGVDDVMPISVQAARWPLQVLQGDQWHLDQLRGLLKQSGALTLRLADPITRRASDPAGATQCVPPGQIPNAWLLRNKYGQVITRVRDGDQFVDPGNTTYQQAAVAFLRGVCDREGWPGIYFDEVNYSSVWSFGDNQATDPAKDIPVNYPTAGQYSAALRRFVQAVTPPLRAAGLQVWINLAGQVNNDGTWNAWTRGIAGDCDGHDIELFVAKGDQAPMSLESGEWKPRLDWVLWQSRQVHGPLAMYHAMTTDPAQARYALATYLLGSEGRAWFSASQDPYTVGQELYTADMVAAQQLGRPLGPYSTVGGDIYVRDFEHGRVAVNPSEKSVRSMAPTSGVITLA